MLDYIKTTVVGAAALTLSSLAVNAAPMVNFTVDPTLSSVTVTDNGGALCGNCGIGASVVATNTTYPIGTNDTATFDFLNWTADGNFFSGGVQTYSVQATLAFSEPAGATTSSGGGGTSVTAFGNIVGGTLNWTDVPSMFSYLGSDFIIDFQGGAALVLGEITTKASITGVNVVPLPAAGLLLLGGIAGLGFVSRKRKAA